MQVVELAPDPRVVELERQVEQLQVALATNRVSGTAVGLLLAQYRMNREQAFACLVAQSQRMNLRLAVVALDLVERAEANAQQGGTAGGGAGEARG